MSKNNSNFSSKVVNVTTSNTNLAEFNTNRESLILFNQGAQDVQINFGSETTAYFVLEAGKGMYFGTTAPVNQVNARTTTGSSNVTVMEG